ncbi:MAG: DUF6306 domain-containing protein [Sphingomonadaceae bacterium]
MGGTPPTRKPASPLCYADSASDVYMGYADRTEILGTLNRLLEAERAGARVARRSRQDAPTPAIADLMRVVLADEAHWCAMLSAQIKRLGAVPSSVCGDFYGKTMAIADPLARIAFLNRGQRWVVRKLAELLPRVRDDALYAQLRAMHDSHVTNIAAAEAVHAAHPGGQ